MLVQRFASSFRRDFPDLCSQPLVVALSGGADSTALLHLLVRAGSHVPSGICAVHVHHHLRGEEADEDAAFCAALARRLEVAFQMTHLRPEPPAGRSPEAWWREERYRLLEQARERAGAAAVLTAHTRDDQAETVLIKLLRGSGPRGVAGIRKRRAYIARPLLEMGRTELRDWLRLVGEGWREDSSNRGSSNPRGWVRHELLPLVERAFPRSVEHLTAFAECIRVGEEELSRGMREVAWPTVHQSVPLAPVRALPEALRDRWVLELGGRLPLREPVSRRQLASVAAMLDHGTPTAVDLGRRFVLRRRGHQLHLSPPPVEPFPPQDAAGEVVLGGAFRVRLGASGTSSTAHRAALAAPLDRLRWRPPHPGERFAGKPLSRLLAAAGVPREWRRAWPLLEAGDRIVWVPAVGVALGYERLGAEELLVEVEEPW